MCRKYETHMSDLKHHSSKQIPANCYHTVTVLCCLRTCFLLELAFCFELQYMLYCFIKKHFFEHIFFMFYLLIFGEDYSEINVTWECSIFSLERTVVFMLCFVLCKPGSSWDELEQGACDIRFCKPGPDQRNHRLW